MKPPSLKLGCKIRAYFIIVVPPPETHVLFSITSICTLWGPLYPPPEDGKLVPTLNFNPYARALTTNSFT